MHLNTIVFKLIFCNEGLFTMGTIQCLVEPNYCYTGPIIINKGCISIDKAKASF